jgi:hypothetical protein
MRQNGFQAGGRQTRHGAQRQQNDRPHMAYYQRHLHQGRLQQSHRPTQPGPLGQRRKTSLPRGAQGLHAVAPQPLHVQQAAQHAQRHS